MVQIHTPQPVKMKNIPLRYVFYFTCVVLDLNHRSNVVQPPQPVKMKNTPRLGCIFLFIPHPAIIKWILQQKYAIISTIITNKRKR